MFHITCQVLICFTTFSSLRQMRMSFLLASVGCFSNRLSGGPLQSVTHTCEKSKETGVVFMLFSKIFVNMIFFYLFFGNVV